MPVFHTDINITTTIAIEAATEEEARAKAESLVEEEVRFVSRELNWFNPKDDTIDDRTFIGMVYKIDHNYADWGPVKSKG